jgi:branched-subunit amino acid aminotransferase/4-amino-4-deoxychorismate lyase
MTYWFAGQPVEGTELTLAINEPAFFYGATVFTTLRVYQNDLAHPLTRWTDHLHRLRHGLAVFQWPEPDWDRVRQGAEWLKSSFPVLRITCLPDGRELVTGRFLPSDLDQMQAQGITAWLATGDLYRRALPGYKTGNYLAGWLALQEAQRRKAREAILMNKAGHWLETSTGNLWGWADGQWWTPPLNDDLLPGVTRLHLLEHLQHQGISVCKSPWSAASVYQFEALAYSNTGVQIVPVHTVQGNRSTLKFDPHHRSLQTLRAAFEEGKV